MDSIVVIGSSNTDMVIKTGHLPVPGETVTGGEFFVYQGGKGANQAVAAARLGGRVSLIANIGDDIFGRQSLESIKAEGIDISGSTIESNKASGVALISVDKHGENCISVASGSNATLFPQNLHGSLPMIKAASIVMMQLEIPMETIIYVAELCKTHNITFILNPAPACALPYALFPNINIITPNEKEAEMLTGVKVKDRNSATEAARILKSRGVGIVIITMGKQGALIVTNEYEQMIPSLVVDAVDTTGAGDVFNGALSVAIAEGKELTEAVRFACKAAAISVTRLGAQSSAPVRKEVESYL
ncbi:MAG TPA: ribokinase [Mucilaginibacter sp.]